MESHLVQARGWKLQPRREVDANGLATDRELFAAVPHIAERVELVIVKKCFTRLLSFLSHVAGIVGEGFRCVARLPALVLILERLRQIPVIERPKRLDSGGLQLVDEPAVKSSPF